MSMVMTAAPAVEPVTLAEAKAHLRVDGNAEDAYISSLVVTSRLQIEAALGLALMPQSWRLTIDAWPHGDALELPIRPVQQIRSIEVTHAIGVATTVSPSSYLLDGHGLPARLVLTTLSPPLPEVPADGIAIEMIAGFGPAASDVPQPIRHALLLLVAHWFECREPTSTGKPATGIPDAVNALLAPFRVVRL
jgi:uncharacterized phiE125 gp8 family phage protein